MGGGDNLSNESKNTLPSNAMSATLSGGQVSLDIRSLPLIDFALLGHPSNYEHLGDIFVHSRADFSREKLAKYKATLSKIFEWTPSYAAKAPLTIDLADGRQLSGRLIFCTFLPEMMNTPRQMRAAYQKTLDGCRVAKNKGAKVVGLGGFTSIVC